MICTEICWGKFTTICPAQGHRLIEASGASLQRALLMAPSGAQDTASGLALDFKQPPVPCCTASPSSARAQVAASDIYTDTRPLLADSHKLWEQAAAEHPLPTTSSSSRDAGLREAGPPPGLSSLQRGPATPPRPGKPFSCFPGVGQCEKLVCMTDG